MNKKLLLLTAALGLAGVCARASVLFEDDFSYADGSLTSNPDWTGHSGTTGQIQVTSGTVALTDSDSEDANASLSSIISSGTVFFAMDVSFDDPGSYTGTDFEYFTHLADNGFGYVARVESSDYTATGYKLGISNSSSTDATWGTELAYNTIYRLVASYDLGTGASTMWIDPASAGDTSISTSSAGSIGSVERVMFRQAGASPDQIITLDNLIVGTTFEDVTSAIPEPSVAALALIGLGFIARFLRRRK